jgi:hypothetical protein
LKSKFKNPPKEGKEILDSVKLSIEKKEILNIKKQSNIFRLIELQKISDSTFFNALENIKKDVEKIALDSIKNNFNFRDLDKLIKIEYDNLYAQKTHDLDLTIYDELKSIIQ